MIGGVNVSMHARRRRLRQLAAEKQAKEALKHGQGTSQNDGTAGDGAGDERGSVKRAGDTTRAGSNGNATAGATGATAGADTGTGTGGTPGNPASEGGKQDHPAKLTQAEYDEIMRNKENVMAELKRLGVEFSDRDKADPLRELLNAALTIRGLLP